MMNTNSNRYQLQILMESWIGCTNPEKLSDYKSTFEKYAVTEDAQLAMHNALIEDGADIFYKGALTFADALTAASKGYQSWAIIKFYYAAFYLLRALFAARGLGIVKCNGIYTLRNEKGAVPVKRTGQKHKGETTKGDHKTTVYIFEKEMSAGELLLSNTIEGATVFDWMMDAREAVNYRQATFAEPEFNFFEASMKEKGGALNWVNVYLADETGSYLFLQQHCCIAVPLHLIQKVQHEFSTRLGVRSLLSQDRYDNLIQIMEGTGLENNNRFLSLFQSY